MLIKFLEPVTCINTNMAIAIGTSSDPSIGLPREDGEIKYFDGADPYVISKSLFVQAKEGQSLEITSYEYDEDTNRLIFKTHHNCTHNKVCTDLIDITTYEVESVSKTAFKIIEV